MGGRHEVDTSNDAQDIAAIQAAINAGITLIDTAESYGSGHAEELLGQALQGYDRSKLFLTSKVSRWNQSYDGLLHAFEASLKRIDTDHLDLYLLHRYPDVGLPIAETMRAMDRLVDEGLVKHVGVCNCSINRFEDVQKHTKNKLVCNQLHYNVQYREVEDRGLLKFCQDNDTFLVAWRPLQKGALLPAAPIITEIAQKYGKTPAQVLLNWLISQKNVLTLAKTGSAAHLEENLGALNWNLAPEDIERIRAEFPNQQLRSDAVPMDYPADIAK